VNIFITGISSGIGKDLALEFAKNGHNVYGISRRELEYSDEKITHQCLDMNDIGAQKLKLLDSVDQIDIVILNAGVLGEVKKIQDTTTEDLKNTMQINLWSQKNLIDNLLANHNLKNVFAISSGAANKGSKGWAGYSLSKAAFKILIELYSNEESQIHFLNIAPGLVNTKMQDYICDEVDKEKFPNMQRLKDAREDGSMISPKELATKFYGLLDRFYKEDSGDFIDLRNF